MKNQTSTDSNDNGEIICELVQNGVTDFNTDKLVALKESNFHIKRKALSRHDEEIIRIIGQHLKHLGFNKTVDCLIKESGCELENLSASKFCEYCLSGAWSKAENVLKELKPYLENEDSYVKMKFILLEQKFLEFLEDNCVLDALHCLRIEMSPLKFNVERVHELSSLLMCASVDDLFSQAKWEGKGLVTRQRLVEKLLAFLPPSVMLPLHRLETLIAQAFELQREKCLFHNSSTSIDIRETSIIVDHQCSRDSFPSETRQVLSDHCDEVLFLRFSNNGKYLATGSKDMKVIIWEVKSSGLEKLHVLNGHSYGISYLAWSPNDVYLIACGPEDCCEIWLWQVQTATLHRHISHSPDDSLTCCSWYSDSKRFVVGGIRGQFYQCDLDGNILESWDGVRVNCLHVINENTVLASDTHHRIKAYSFEDIVDKLILQESHAIMSFTASKDNSKVILNISNQGVNLWDVKCKMLVRRFRGVVYGSFIIHSCFGGANDDFIASGSEDNTVYIWHHTKETPILTLHGHTGTVNCVHWNPTNPGMLASASDDGTVRIWMPLKSKSLTDDSTS
ncbi:WD repeat-containing protein 26 isoform X1 [Hydra vulgaris]|uniref:WD repeat-containing protein 26 n=1 Tax=Hydra vulgaris TaxID=6087 RepID=T2M4V0_HYDVU|nr:WD repeat-containing protein 26 [Hydra vulgaris]